MLVKVFRDRLETIACTVFLSAVPVSANSGVPKIIKIYNCLFYLFISRSYHLSINYQFSIKMAMRENIVYMIQRNNVVKGPWRKQIKGPYCSDFLVSAKGRGFSFSYNRGYNCGYNRAGGG